MYDANFPAIEVDYPAPSPDGPAPADEPAWDQPSLMITASSRRNA